MSDTRQRPGDVRPEGHVSGSPAERGSVGGPGGSGDRRPGDLTARESLRWLWRQVTSMRTALVLLLLLAVAAVPGSVVPQADVDALEVSRWQEAHPTLTPIYERLGLFSVYDSVWFSAIYILLMISLVGCILPRTAVYLRGLRARPARAPRHLTRLPDSTSYTTTAEPAEVLEAARAVLRKRRFRVDVGDDAVASERGYLREAGNLLFHVSVVVVLVGVALGGLFGYQGGVIVLVGGGFSNNLTQYDDFVPGDLYDPADMEPFSFDVTDFDISWLTDGPRAGMAQQFVSHLDYREAPGEETQTYDLRVNHPLTIGDTDVFLIGHGYAPVITIRDGNGDVVRSGPVVFLPSDPSFRSFGVVKSPDARPEQIALEGEFYPTYAFTPEQGPFSAFGDAVNPAIVMQAYVGDVGLDDGSPQSTYVLDKEDLELLENPDGSLFRIQLSPGQEVELPDGAGTVSFDGVQRWNRIQISQTPGKMIALAGVVLALIGLLGSLFIRPRRVWVRARAGRGTGGGTLVEVAALDRSGGHEVGEELERVVAALRDSGAPPAPDERAADEHTDEHTDQQHPDEHPKESS
ncbi:cytochrome c biogenesis protein ResB [Nocardioides lentus]|uniref:Cytochrome c biogenesis protein ResB n=1 Tax=Nocardioides lentus TaxID=338077 RepID=A0ABP5ATV4_9ACTN